MAVGQNLLFGRMKQKIGGIVTSTWKGINVIKSKPLTVANPKTDLQLMRRSALIQAVALARTISAAINLGFKEQAVFKSAFNAFVGYTLRNAFDYSGPPDAQMVQSNILVSQGTISPTPIATVISDQSSNNIILTWLSLTLLPGQSNSDVPVLVAYNQTQSKWMLPIGGTATRNDDTLEADFTVGDLVAGNSVLCFLFFYNTASRKSSDSALMTSVVVA